MRKISSFSPPLSLANTPPNSPDSGIFSIRSSPPPDTLTRAFVSARLAAFCMTNSETRETVALRLLSDEGPEPNGGNRWGTLHRFICFGRSLFHANPTLLQVQAGAIGKVRFFAPPPLSFFCTLYPNFSKEQTYWAPDPTPFSNLRSIQLLTIDPKQPEPPIPTHLCSTLFPDRLPLLINNSFVVLNKIQFTSQLPGVFYRDPSSLKYFFIEPTESTKPPSFSLLLRSGSHTFIVRATCETVPTDDPQLQEELLLAPTFV